MIPLGEAVGGPQTKLLASNSAAERMFPHELEETPVCVFYNTYRTCLVSSHSGCAYMEFISKQTTKQLSKSYTSNALLR